MNWIILAAVVLILAGGFTFYYYRPKKQKRTESIYTHALNAMVRGDTRTALNHLRDVVKQDTNHINAYLQMGDILREEGHTQAAVKIHQSLTVRPNLSNDIRRDIHQSLALDFEQMDYLNKARREAELVLKLDRKNLWANHFLLKIFENQREWDKATQITKSIQKLKQSQDPNQIARFLVYQGMDKLEKGHKKEAEAQFLKAIKTAPEFGLPYLRLGDLFAENRELVKAIENWESYALFTPEEGRVVYTKIESALFDLGRFSEVEKFYERILEKDPSNLNALAKLANVLEEKGEHNSALNLVEDALSKNKGSVHGRLMKLKLSLHISKPHELSNQIDEIIQLLTSSNEK
ncbi:MAG: tetratricopeptide repeat protein [Candidatus Marinimicrobia bacterium]|nr:tetratricopeptide repeat protein [Candidatus Neomarinimicrobiota bacterium]MBT3675089.1 tetratricopeptide repeat protein [Candidatus Neomarinimicrobiota bacterium]MBT3763559.1 tetratricopeptide repeat protein [Candidatus Neomarinimicrobiota bacterium]MBT4067552.1 tetratricopeptide repeat protein [Candidatus Neomarinimicrobiota bacterium]MBT4270383.1 tetratricopeptide repeat protein [Candidatus Neomarinimicrobiota bacterium]